VEAFRDVKGGVTLVEALVGGFVAFSGGSSLEVGFLL